MNNRVVKYIMLGGLILLTYYSYIGIQDFSAWRDTGDDYFDIENENRSISAKEVFSYIFASIPFICLLSVTIFFLYKYFFKKKKW